MAEPQKLNIGLDKTTPVLCDNCQHGVFVDGVMLRTASRFLVGTDQDPLMPINVFSCAKCGHVNDRFLPEVLRSVKVEG